VIFLSRKTDASSPSGGVQIATGTYTGDGAATQAITGVGFQPRFVMIWCTNPDQAERRTLGLKADVDGINAGAHGAGIAALRYSSDLIISLDADGFTVGDGTPLGFNYLNFATIVYRFVCFR